MAMIKLKKCPICKKENWHDLSHLRADLFWQELDYLRPNENTGFKVCKDCGFVTYDYIPIERLNYLYNRDLKVHGHKIVTQNRKQIYHQMFFEEAGIPMPSGNILDVGCATGHFLALFEGKKYGIEPDRPQANYAKHVFDIDIIPDMSAPGIQYDLISYYHVLEHLQNPDEELEKAKKHLKPGGLLYVSVPIYADCIYNGDGSHVNSFEEWYHLNHINCLTENSALNLLRDWEVLHLNKTLYCHTYLLKYAPGTREIIPDDWQTVEPRLKAQQKAIALYSQKKFAEAIDTWPNYPEAHAVLLSGLPHAQDFNTVKHGLEKAIEICDDTYILKANLARLYYQWGTKPEGDFISNNILIAEQMFDEILKEKPYDEIIIMKALLIWRYRKQHKKAIEMLSYVYTINPMKYNECMNYIGAIYKDWE